MLTTVLIFLLLVVAVLAIPVTVTYRFSWERTFSGDLDLRWAFGLVRVRSSSGQAVPGRRDPEAAAPKARPSGRSSRKRPDVVAAVRLPSFRRRVIRFVGDLWSSVKKKNVEIRVRLGLGDPADTGQLWGLVGPAAGMLGATREVAIAVEPDFLDATFEVASSGTVRVVPLQLAGLLLALLLSPSFLRGAMRMRAPG